MIFDLSVSQAAASHPSRGVALSSMFESFQGRIPVRLRFRGVHTDEEPNADLLDVVAAPRLDEHPARSELRMRATNQQSRLLLHTQENK